MTLVLEKEKLIVFISIKVSKDIGMGKSFFVNTKNKKLDV